MNKTTLRLADEIHVHPKQGHYFMNVVFHGVVGIGPIGYRPARNDLTILSLNTLFNTQIELATTITVKTEY